MRVIFKNPKFVKISQTSSVVGRLLTTPRVSLVAVP